jgi:hypothetical protein
VKKAVLSAVLVAGLLLSLIFGLAAIATAILHVPSWCWFLASGIGIYVFTVVVILGFGEDDGDDEEEPAVPEIPEEVIRKTRPQRPRTPDFMLPR